MEEILFNFIADHITFTDAEKKVISSLMLIRNCTKGEILLQEGQRTADSYFVIKGCLRSYYIIDGEEKTTEIFTELDVAVPACTIDGSPSRHYISCVEDTSILISNPELEEKGFAEFRAFEALCWVMSEKLAARKQFEFDHFKISSPAQRYQLLQQHRPDLLQRVPQHQLASYLGITPPSLSRLRKRLSQKS